MAENWSADVKKYVADANEKAIENRVTVYYLLADHFGKLSMFG